LLFFQNLPALGQIHLKVFVPKLVGEIEKMEGADYITGKATVIRPRHLLNAWVTNGWLEMSDAARKSRRYLLSAEYRQFIGHLSAE